MRHKVRLDILDLYDFGNLSSNFQITDSRGSEGVTHSGFGGNTAYSIFLVLVFNSRLIFSTDQPKVLRKIKLIDQLALNFENTHFDGFIFKKDTNRRNPSRTFMFLKKYRRIAKTSSKSKRAFDLNSKNERFKFVELTFPKSYNPV